MSNLSIGMPGPDCRLGECQLCGKTFMDYLLFGDIITTGHVPGIAEELAMHIHCAELLFHEIPWKDLPDGPIRRVFEKAEKELKPGASQK